MVCLAFKRSCRTLMSSIESSGVDLVPYFRSRFGLFRTGKPFLFLSFPHLLAYLPVFNDCSNCVSLLFLSNFNITGADPNVIGRSGCFSSSFGSKPISVIACSS